MLDSHIRTETDMISPDDATNQGYFRLLPGFRMISRGEDHLIYMYKGDFGYTYRVDLERRFVMTLSDGARITLETWATKTWARRHAKATGAMKLVRVWDAVRIGVCNEDGSWEPSDDFVCADESEDPYEGYEPDYAGMAEEQALSLTYTRAMAL
jgi:hypothetical protein